MSRYVMTYNSMAYEVADGEDPYEVFEAKDVLRRGGGEWEAVNVDDLAKAQAEGKD